MDDQGGEYAAFVRDELDREYSRRDVVNARSATAITSVTGLVTLVVAAAAVVRGQGHLLQGFAALWLVVSVIALLAAGVLAVLAGLSWKFEVTSQATLSAMIGEKWGDREVTARSVVAQCNARTLASLRKGTNTKTRLLLWAYALQIAAIASLVADLIAVIQ